MTTIEAQSSRRNSAAGQGFLVGTIRGKLLVTYILVGLILLVTIVGIAYLTAQRVLEAQALAKLEALRETRSDQLRLWFDDRRRDIQVLSVNPTTILAADVLHETIETSHSLGSSYAERLQAVANAYRNQPDLQDAGDKSSYSTIHKRFHLFFQKYRDIYGFADIYLVTPDGNIVYSINKEADFGTNLVDGPYAMTNIGVAFRQALLADDPDFTVFADFAFYEPSHQSAAFLASPIFSNNNLVGVLIFQLPIGIVNTIMNLWAGLGDTGETYAVGPDFLFRNDSRFLDQLGTATTILNEEFRVATQASRSALSGESDSQIIDGYRGRPVLSAWKPIVLQAELAGSDPGSVTWGVLAEIDEAEALQPANDLLRSLLVVGVIAGVAILGIAFVVANQIAQPIRRLTATAEQIGAGDLGQRAEVTTHDEIGTLATTFNQMTAQLEATVGTLEQRVAKRTRRLEIVATLSERLIAMLDLDQLSLELVNQVKERFGYYHAHVYLLDKNRQQLVMTAGVGAAGARMKVEGHAIPLNAPTSLVARAARSREVVSVDNVREAADWLPNPLLPDTYSEMAVPIVLDEQVVGVLDVQEDEIAALDDSDAALLRSLANQVAIAIRNARLFEEVETALAEARAAQEKYVQQTWDKTRITPEVAAHLHLRSAVTALPEAIMAEAKRLALAQDGPAIVALNGDEARPQSIVAPVTLSGQTIGILQVHQPDATADTEVQAWTDEDLALIEAVLDQVAQAAENLRLFEETQERAGREQTIREITEKMRAATNLAELVKTTAQELGQHFPAEYALVNLGIVTEPLPDSGRENGKGQPRADTE